VDSQTNNHPLRSAQSPEQLRAWKRRRLYAAILGKRNWEHVRSINALGEQDRQLAQGAVEVIVR